MSSRTKRSFFTVPYINHLAMTEIDNEPTSFWGFLDHIGASTLKQFPIMNQHGGTCTIFGTATALSVANRKMEPIPQKCEGGGNYTSKDMSKGASMATILKRYNKDIQKKFEKLSYSMTMKIGQSSNASRFAKFLKNHVVVCGGEQLGYPTIHSPYKSGGKLVPGFFGTGTDSHTICIVGSYNDKDLGPCFVTKCTNNPWQILEKGYLLPYKTKVKVNKKNIARKYVGLAVYPAALVDKINAGKNRVSGISDVYGLTLSEWPDDLSGHLKTLEIKEKPKEPVRRSGRVKKNVKRKLKF